MPKLHQILAIEADIRAQAQKDLTQAHHGLQKQELLQGISREYRPVREDDKEVIPAERQLLQIRVPEVIRETARVYERTFDITATRDYANLSARADVVLPDGTILVKDAPTTYLLWLEKRLTDLHTFVTKLPTLPSDIEWIWDGNQNCYKNKQEIKTHRTVKTAYPLVLYDATDKHPAQVVKETKDEIAGYWTTIKYSGSIPLTAVKEMKERVETLQAAVKLAREKANQVEAEEKRIGGAILKHVFGL